jgi:hypothetical protein
MLPFFDWCQRTPLALTLRNSILAAPILDVFHLLGLALLCGPVLILNLRLMGLALPGRAAAEIRAALMPWFWRGFALSALSGVPFFIANAIKCYNGTPFYVKMSLLAMAITFQTTVVRSAADSGDRARLPALVSTVLWTGVPVAGYAIEIL